MPSITLNELIKQLNQLRLKNKLKGDIPIRFHLRGESFPVEGMDVTHYYSTGEDCIMLYREQVSSEPSLDSSAYRLYTDATERREAVAQARVTEERVEMAYQQAMMEAQAPVIPRSFIFQRWNPFRGV